MVSDFKEISILHIFCNIFALSFMTFNTCIFFIIILIFFNIYFVGIFLSFSLTLLLPLILLKGKASHFFIMARMKHAGPQSCLNSGEYPFQTSYERFLKAWEAIDAQTNFMVRYPRMDEPDVTQVDEGCLGIHYASFDFGLRFPYLRLSWDYFIIIKLSQLKFTLMVGHN